MIPGQMELHGSRPASGCRPQHFDETPPPQAFPSGPVIGDLIENWVRAESETVLNIVAASMCRNMYGHMYICFGKLDSRLGTAKFSKISQTGDIYTLSWPRFCLPKL